MILSDNDLRELINDKELIIEPFFEKDLREASIQLHLSKTILKPKDGVTTDLNDSTTFLYDKFEMDKKGYQMKPQEFLLASTLEKITIPNGYMGWIETRGTIARAGIQAHLCDAHIDPGSSLNITLQLKNQSNNTIIIYPEIYLIKLYLFKMTNSSKNPYNGKFQNQSEANGFKGL